MLGVELHLENDRAALLAPYLTKLVGSPIGTLKKALEWDQRWSSGRGRLLVRYPLTEDRNTVARTLIELIGATRSLVAETITNLAKNGKSEA